MHRLVLAVARLLLTLRHPALIVRFATKLGYLPNPAAPGTYHELMLWRKTVDRNPLFVTLTDKLAAKDYVRGICPELAQAKTLWSGRDPADIPPGLLTGNAVVKANHGCAMNVFVSGGRPNRAAVIATARRWLKKRYGRRNGEWAYWPIVPTVFIEERLELSGGAIATDIKVHVCAGTVCHVWVEDKRARLSHLFDCDGKPLPGRDPDYPREDQALPVSDRLVDYVRRAAAIAPRIAGDLDPSGSTSLSPASVSMPVSPPSTPPPATARGPIRKSWGRSSETGGSTDRTICADGIAALQVSMPARSRPGLGPTHAIVGRRRALARPDQAAPSSRSWPPPRQKFRTDA
ncbi:ATP-grasp fold amidoligase family protein [Mesorhizobium sp. M4B.F.Ca.ET.017.02.2.1]|uniref:ATP-grasp fold amidoligase family protein n=1 Tax=Mesorhizobium sp. M4B.F.Ca.ET.017.02.2.1 TaxID=2496649 RepID=UPI0016742B0E|nr:ATP-grasp fold amidoligase family protein [Mesorhizobium sp. M4B.F.Ca.ET.017.02.2.1]